MKELLKNDYVTLTISLLGALFMVGGIILGFRYNNYWFSIPTIIGGVATFFGIYIHWTI